MIASPRRPPQAPTCPPCPTSPTPREPLSTLKPLSPLTSQACRPLDGTASPAAVLAGEPWPEWALDLHEGWLAFRVRLEAWLQALQGLQAGKRHPELQDGDRSLLELSQALCLQVSHWHCEWVQALPLSGPDLASTQALVERTQAWLNSETLIDTLDRITMDARRHAADSSVHRVPPPSPHPSLRELLLQALGQLTRLLSMAPGLGPLACAAGLSPTARTASTPPSHPDATMDG